MSSTSKLGMAFIAALVVWGLAAGPAPAHHSGGLTGAALPVAMGSDRVSASIASAAAATTIDAVDSPAPGWEPSNVTVARGSTVTMGVRRGGRDAHA